MVHELYLNTAVILRKKKEKEIKASHGDDRILTSFMENVKHLSMENKPHSKPHSPSSSINGFQKFANHIFNLPSFTPRLLFLWYFTLKQNAAIIDNIWCRCHKKRNTIAWHWPQRVPKDGRSALTAAQGDHLGSMSELPKAGAGVGTPKLCRGRERIKS